MAEKRAEGRAERERATYSTYSAKYLSFCLPKYRQAHPVALESIHDVQMNRSSHFLTTKIIFFLCVNYEFTRLSAHYFIENKKQERKFSMGDVGARIGALLVKEEALPFHIP